MTVNVLIADDSATIRAVIKKALSLCIPQLGEVHEASDGIAALATLADHQVDVVLVDINMPRMNGIELVKKMKQDSSTAALPVVIISAEATDERLAELANCDIAGYIRKPFRPEQLRQTVYQILEISDDSAVGQHAGCDF